MTNLSRQIALPLACYEAQTYHDPLRPGFFSMLVRGPNGHMRQQSDKLAQLPDIIQRLDPTLDCWISQGEFFRRNRQLVNLWRMPLAYIDLDTYNVEHLKRRPPEFLLACLLQKCEDSGLPEPSLVVYSGRGLQVKWLFVKPVPRNALPRWQALQNELCRRLAYRNNVVHHLLDLHPLSTAEGCHQAVDYLNGFAALTSHHRKQLEEWAHHHDEMKIKMGDFMKTPEFRNMLVDGIYPDGTVDWTGSGIERGLRDAANALSVGDWTRLEDAIAWLKENQPNQIPSRYGCKTYRQAISLSKAFDVKKQTAVDGHPALFFKPTT